MTTEEKAKAYDRAIAKAQKELQSCGSTDCDAARQIYRFFPELQESEDEKVKRIIHSISNKISFHLHDIFTEEEFQCFDAWSNAWLKKQGSIPKEVTYTQEVIAWLENRSNTSKEAGFEWNAEKKELKMLENQGKSMWTEEDEERLQSCIIELQGKGLMGGVDTIDTKWLKALKQRINDNFEKTCKNDTLLDLLNKMPSCITVNGIDYHFVLKKTIAYMAFYEGEGEGSGKVIFWMAGDPVDLLTEMLEKLKKEGLLE